MITGIGIDHIDVIRIEKIIRQRQSFLNYVFFKDEIIFCSAKPNKYEHFAARFAAKEALLKACGVGLQINFELNKIEVSNDDRGKPYFIFHDQATDFIKKLGKIDIHLSMSHTGSVAMAIVIIEKE